MECPLTAHRAGFALYLESILSLTLPEASEDEAKNVSCLCFDVRLDMPFENSVHN